MKMSFHLSLASNYKKHMAETKENKFTYHLLDLKDKFLILKLDMNINFTSACEVVAIFSPSKKTEAEKAVRDLNKN
jgi:hypothetical protein